MSNLNGYLDLQPSAVLEMRKRLILTEKKLQMAIAGLIEIKEGLEESQPIQFASTIAILKRYIYKIETMSDS